MAFNTNTFIRQARDQGYSDNEIDAVLVQHGQKPMSGLRKFIESPAIPIIGGGLGLLGGAALAVPTFGASLPFGGFAGAAGATALQKSLSDILGYTTQTGPEQVDEGFNNGVLGATAGEGLNLATNFFNPMGSLGRTRSTLIGDKTVPTEEFQQKSLQNLYENPYYKQAPAETQNAADTQILNFHANQPVSETTPINNIYQDLKPFETQGKAYGGNTPTAQGTNLASRAIRSYLNQNISWPAQKVNDVYSFLAKNQTLLKALGIGGGAVEGAVQLYKKITGAAQ